MTRTIPHIDVAVVGTGHGGAAFALAVRKLAYEGTVALIGDEPDPPYERPPLSKDYLAGEKDWSRMQIRTMEAWRERNVELISSTSIASVEPARAQIVSADGRQFTYGSLVWAAGGSARPLTCPGASAKGVLSIRTRADVEAIRALLPAASRVVIVGGGFVGLEAAATMVRLGKQVTLVEAGPRVLGRVSGEPISRFYEREHAARGVTILVSTQVLEVVVSDGAARGVRISSGDVIEADLVIVGIGLVPSVEPLKQAGVICANGVRVDSGCRSSVPGIFAIGDCAEQQNRWAQNDWVRLESVQNANEMASCAAATVCGREAPAMQLPWFWSDQYDLKLQTIGLSRGADSLVVRGSIADRRFSVVYLRSGQVIALDCVNCAVDFVHGRHLISNASTPDLDKLADASISLQTLK